MESHSRVQRCRCSCVFFSQDFVAKVFGVVLKIRPKTFQNGIELFAMDQLDDLQVWSRWAMYKER